MDKVTKQLLNALRGIRDIQDLDKDSQWYPDFDGIAFSRGSRAWQAMNDAIREGCLLEAKSCQ